MRNDKLILSTVSTTGKFSSRVAKGAAYLTVMKGFNEDTNQIAIEVSHTTGVGPFKRSVDHETALINITFADNSVWSGTFDQLKEILKPQVN